MAETKSKQVDMLNGSLADKIFFFALPLAAASILQQLFNSADLAVVGRFSSSEAMAAVGSNSAVINLIVSLFTGLAVGANVVIATLIGQNKKEEINDAVHTIYLTAIVSGIFLLFVGIFVAQPLLSLMGAPENVMNLAVEYLQIYFLAMPFMMVYNFGSAILRSKGDSRRPLVALAVAGVLNIILNLVFVIGFGMSVAGVAIPTVISNVLSSIIITVILLKEEEDFRLDFRKLKFHSKYFMQMVKIGLPAGIQGMVFSLSNVVIQSAINSFGSDAIAGATAASNFEFMCYFIVNAFAQAAVTFTSQNFGAGKYDRCKQVFKISFLVGETMTLCLSLIFWFGRDFFIQFFTTDSEVIHFAYIRLLLVGTLEIGTGSYEISGGCLRGMGKSMVPAILTVFGSCIFRLIYIYTIFKIWPTFPVLFAVYPISWVITGTLVNIAYFSIRKSLFARGQYLAN